MMKKRTKVQCSIMSMLLVIGLILSTFPVAVQAAATVTISDLKASIDRSTMKVSVSGKISSGAGKQVTIRVLDPDEFDDYVNQITSGANGEFSASYTTTSTTKGTFKVKVSGLGVTSPAITEFINDDVIQESPKPTKVVPTQTPIVIVPTQTPIVIVPTQTPIVIVPTQTPIVIVPTPTVTVPNNEVKITSLTASINSGTKLVAISGAISSGAGKQVTIRVIDPNGNDDYIYQTSSGTNGTFEVKYTSTSGATGTYTVKVSGAGIGTPVQTTFKLGNGTEPVPTATVTPVVPVSTPTITPVPVNTSGKVNITSFKAEINPVTKLVTISGTISSGSNKQVTIRVIDPNENDDFIYQTTSTANGAFNVTYTTMSDTFGTYKVKASGVGMDSQVQTTFTYEEAGKQTPSPVVSPVPTKDNGKVTISSLSAWINVATKVIGITGVISSGAGQQVTVRVIDPNGNDDYIFQTSSGNNGAFSVSYTTTNEALGNYIVKVGALGLSTPAQTTFVYQNTPQSPAPTDNQGKTVIDPLDARIDQVTKLVTVSGAISSGAGKQITIRVIDPEGNDDYIYQTISGQNGQFSISYTTMSNTEGIFTVKVGGQGVTPPAQTTFALGTTNPTSPKPTPTVVVSPKPTVPGKVTIDSLTASIDNDTKIVTISGVISSGSGKQIAIRVIDPQGNSDYLYQITSGTNGKFSVSYTTENTEFGIFKVKVGGSGLTTPVETTFVYSDSTQPTPTPTVIPGKVIISALNASINPATKLVTISGKISSGEGKQVSIRVIDPDGNDDFIYQATSGANGEFSVTYTTLSTVEGKYKVKVSGLGVTAPAQTTFDYIEGVLPTPSIIVPTGTPGKVTISGLTASIDASTKTVTVSGKISSGAGKQVTIRVLDPNDNDDFIYQATSGANGAFVVSYTTSNTEYGTYKVKASGAGVSAPAQVTFEYKDGTTVPSPTPTDIPGKVTISNLNASIDPITKLITVSGKISSGEGKQVTIRVSDPDENDDFIYQAVSGANGVFVVSYTTLNTIMGTYKVKVGGIGMSVPAQTTFEYGTTVPTPTIIGPTPSQGPVAINGLTASINVTTKVVTISGSISSGSGKQVSVRVLDPNGNDDYIYQTTSGANGKFTLTYTTQNTEYGTYKVKVGGAGISVPVQTTFEYKKDGTTEPTPTPTNSGKATIDSLIASVDPVTKLVTISGVATLGAGVKLNVRVVDPNGNDILLYQVTSGVNGKLILSYMTVAETVGTYKVFVDGDQVLPAQTTFFYGGDGAVVSPAPVQKVIKVQMYNSSTSATSNSIYPKFKLVNTGSSDIDLSKVKVRYYYTADGDKSQSFWCDWSPVGSSNVTGTFVKMPSAKTGADTYLEIGFTSGAGKLAAGASIEVQGRFAKSDWSNYNQANDYSFNQSASYFADSSKVTVYVADALQNGMEP